MTTVFTNGCFDVLHAGHVALFEKARAFGDKLIVGVNSDFSVRKIKGKNRPIFKEANRVAVLKAIRYIDQVVVFDDPDPLELIHKIRPDVLVKGSDWTEGQIIGGDFVRSYGGRVEIVQAYPGVSTTSVVRDVLDDLFSKAFCFDIDGVIATTSCGSNYAQAQPIRSHINIINYLHRNGAIVHLYTARGGSSGIDWSEYTGRQMEEWGVEYDKLVFNKPSADYYVDDKMISMRDLWRWMPKGVAD